MKKDFKLLPLICWSLAVIITALLYCLLVDNIFSSATKILSVVFVLLAEAAMCLKHFSKKQSILMNVQMMFGAVYLLVTVVLSFIYVNIPTPDIKWFISIHAILLLLLTIADLTVLNFHDRAEDSDARLAKSQSIISSCGVLMTSIIAENETSELKKELLDLSERIKYTDNSVLSGDEASILDMLEELKETLKLNDSGEEAKSKINDIKSLLKIREIYIKQNQRGKF